MWAGQTVGKRLLRLRVLGDRGEPVTVTQVAIRNLLRLVDFLPVFYGVGIVTLFIQGGSKRLGDFAAGTRGGRGRERDPRQDPVTPPPAAPPPPPPPPPPTLRADPADPTPAPHRRRHARQGGPGGGVRGAGRRRGPSAGADRGEGSGPHRRPGQGRRDQTGAPPRGGQSSRRGDRGDGDQGLHGP